MTLKEIRTELLGQHADLRRKIEEARVALERWRGGGARDELRARLTTLGAALEHHNEREEQLLVGVIEKIDAWGVARAEIMNERHVAEHDQLYDALLVASQASTAEAAAPLLAELFAHLLEHMGREESAFLCREVLRDEDEPIEVDSFGG